MTISKEQAEKAKEYLESGSNRSEREMRRKRRLRKKRNTLLFMILIVILLITGGVALTAYLKTNVYQDEGEFKEYVNGQLKSDQLFTANNQAKIEYEYDSPISYAVDYDTYQNKEINNYRDSKINLIKKTFEKTKNAEEKKRAKEHGDEFRYRPLEQALIVTSRTFEAKNGAISLAIYEQSSTEQDKDMIPVSSKVHTYQFSEKTGNKLEALQIFTENYREKCTSYFIDFFKKEYKDDLQDGWEKYLSDDVTNFNKFTVTDTGVVFFFDEGTILDASKGVVSAGIPKEILGDSLRPVVKERYIDPSKPMVAITYDDGPGGKAENRILDCLQKNGAVATFFYLGSRVSADTKTVKRVHNMGCEIGNHTWSHPVLTELKTKGLKKEFSKTNEAIKKACGAEPTVFRPSYGETNSKVNKASGLPVILWSVDTLDWESRNAKKVFKVVKSKKNLDGDIVLMHSIYDSTAKATELIVPYLKKKGYQFVTVSELIKYRYDEQAKQGKEYR